MGQKQYTYCKDYQKAVCISRHQSINSHGGLCREAVLVPPRYERLVATSAHACIRVIIARPSEYAQDDNEKQIAFYMDEICLAQLASGSGHYPCANIYTRAHNNC